MIKIKADTHTHTIASAHAYCTISENAKYASEIGMEAIAITDHAPGMEDAPHLWHFNNLKNIPRELFGVKILYGTELNILDKEGNLDDENMPLDRLDIVNASIHGPCFRDEVGSDCTKAYETVIKNPLVDVICHSGSPAYPYDYEKIVRMAKEHNKLIEINNHSFRVRKSSIPNCKRIAQLCKQYGTGIVVSSDAHFYTDIGDYNAALEMLEEIDFPEALIINRDLASIEEFMAVRKKLFSWNMK